MTASSEEFQSSMKRATKTRREAQIIANTLQEPLLVLDADFCVLEANSPFLACFGLSKEELSTGSLLENHLSQTRFPDIAPLLQELQLRKEQISAWELSYKAGEGETRTFLANASYFDPEEEGSNILVSIKEVSARSAEASERLSQYPKSFRDILAHAPASICTLRGPQHIFELANENYLQLVGNRDLFGKPVREVLPEVEHQGFFEILDQVYQSGEPFVGNEVPIKIDMGEKGMKNTFLDFLYHPTWDAEGKVDGIFAHAVDVTEKVEARKKIEQQEHDLRVLIDTMPAMLWMCDEQGEMTYLNEKWYDYTGQSLQEAAKQGWQLCVHPDDREEVLRVFYEASKERRTFNISFRLYNKTGEYRWVFDNGRPKFDVQGNYEGMMGTLIDVHEEKVKEQLIREKEHRIRSIVEEATVATAVYTGKEMKIEIANDAMLEMWGKDRSVIGKSLREALPELEGQPFHHLLDEVVSTGKIYWGKEDLVRLKKKGELKQGFFNFTYKPLRNEAGEIYGILNMAIDVTETVESKALLKESELHFRQMADLMPEKVANTNAKGDFIYFNQGWLDYTGLSSEELKAQGWTQFIHPEEKEQFLSNWQESMESGADFEMEFRCKNKNGKYKWHLNRAEAVRDEAGDIKMWIGTTTDIQRLKEEEKRKEDFLKMVSHELKTPVTSIKGYVQLLLSLMKKEDVSQLTSLPLEPSLKRIDYQIERLTRLISEMLDLSRIENNKLELQKSSFSINELIEDTVQDIRYTNTQHHIEVEHKFKCRVFADKDRIGQVLINFITNAIKYSLENQRVQVKIDQEAEDKVAISVIDWGIGIAKENQKKIFKRFYRIGGKTEETYSGFGIGLFLAKEIIERHGGEITVESEKGKGSEFKFILDIK